MSWKEVSEIISGEIEKNGRCTSETAWTLAGDLIKKLDIPGRTKKTNDKIDVLAAVKVIPELSHIVAKRGRGAGGLIFKSSSQEEKNKNESETDGPEMVLSRPVTSNVTINNKFEDDNILLENEEKFLPGSLLGPADKRPPLIPVGLQDWIFLQNSLSKFEFYLNGKKYTTTTDRKSKILCAIKYVFNGVEVTNESESNVKIGGVSYVIKDHFEMFKNTLFFVLGVGLIDEGRLV